MRNKAEHRSSGAPSTALVLAIALVLSFVATLRAQAAEYSFCVIYTFIPGTKDGENPYGRLVLDSTGYLYGTTISGGSRSGGTVFRVDKKCNQTSDTILYNFPNKSRDGLSPFDGLVLNGNKLYGTTFNGGKYDDGVGTVFEINRTGGGKGAVADFSSGDGTHPKAALIRDSAGNFYGTTTAGGSGAGVAFQLSKSLKFNPLYVFGKDQQDGVQPDARLAQDAAGYLYGTTEKGGVFGQGTVFKVNKTSQVYGKVYSFSGPDGSAPVGGVVLDSAGNIYGTTALGGPCCGVVFKLNAKGKMIGQFDFNSANGQQPKGDLVLDSHGNVWGTTESGGTGSGIVFELDNKLKRLLFSRPFDFYSDGGSPYAGLILDSEGNLYGTTENGGPYGVNGGAGTVFKVCPYPPGCQ